MIKLKYVLTILVIFVLQADIASSFSIQGRVDVVHPLALKNKFGKAGEKGKIDAALDIKGHIDYGQGFKAKLFYPIYNS